MTENGDQQEQAQQEELSVGEQLRVARERSGFGQKEIARELKLDIAVISALEKNDFDRLPEPIFVCGYLRAYAGLVSIPSDPLVAAFTNRGFQAPPITMHRPAKAQVSSRDMKVRGASIGIALVLVVLLVTWWRTNSIDITDTAPVPVADEETVTMPARLNAKPAMEADTVTGKSVTAPVTVQAHAQPATPQPPAQTETTDRQSVAAAAQPAEPPVAIPAPDRLPVPAGPQSRLVMIFSADSWVEVEDAAGNKLVYDLMREGQRRELTGIAPFKVFLGNAPGVEIEYNGKPFVFTPYIRGDLAHFRLGRSSDAVTAAE